MSDKELLAWAASKLAEAQEGKMYGTVTFYIEAGKITRAETKTQDKPAKPDHGYQRG